MNDGITFLFVSKELYLDFVIFLFFFSLFLQKIHTMPFEVGNNIVGLIPGKHYNTSNDRIVLIGAHWDTFGVSPGLNDNGSGVASLLEVPTNVLLTTLLSTKSCISEYLKKGILNKREYLGPVWLADVWPADDIPFSSIFTYF